ncbi:hypothetical protein DFS34DRAFT_667538 [Phlyctochytrium arcticum]|nr:hypothetical protein DFS34DRAFT_667538 [Phlyctochytrium arcticum]
MRQNFTEDLVTAIMKAVVDGCLTPSHFIWDFMVSQANFYTIKDFRGGAASIFPQKVNDFCLEYETTFGSRAYQFLQGKGWQGVGKNKVLSPTSWEGNFILPSVRTIQRNRASLPIQIVGMDPEWMDQIAADFKAKQAAVGQRQLVGGVGVDETDYGVVTVQRRDGKLIGTIDLGPDLNRDVLSLPNVSETEELINAYELQVQALSAAAAKSGGCQIHTTGFPIPHHP